MYIDTINFSIQGFSYSTTNHYEILDIYLFGSVNRGDDRIDSDIDILVVIEDVDDYIEELIIDSLTSDLNMPQHYFTVVRRSSVMYDISNNSIFFWCLKIDSSVLYSRNDFLSSQLDTLTRFKSEYLINELDSLYDFVQSLNDINYYSYDSILDLFIAVKYLVHHLCICILIAYEDITFNKFDMVERCMDNIGYSIFPFDYDEYIILRSITNMALFIDDSYEELSLATIWIGHIEKLLGIAYIVSQRRPYYSLEYKS